MKHQLTITVSDEVFQPLIEAALKEGCTPEEYLGERVAQLIPAKAVNGGPKEKGDITRLFGMYDEALSAEERAQAKARLKSFAGAVNSGDPHSADNERIDADLARGYANTHEAED